MQGANEQVTYGGGELGLNLIYRRCGADGGEGLRWLGPLPLGPSCPAGASSAMAPLLLESKLV
jgi:hypothetical protein